MVADRRFKMKTIKVEHRVSRDPVYCSEGDSGGFRDLCDYMKYRINKAKYQCPRCTLFSEWLDTDMHRAKKCEACLQAEEV